MYRRHTNTLRPLLSAAFRQILQEVRRAFGYPLAGERGVNVLWKVLEERKESCNFAAGEIQLMYSCINNNLIWKSLTN